MWAQEESSNASEIWKTIIDAGILVSMETQMPEKNPNKTPTLGLPCTSIWPLKRCSKNLSRIAVLISPHPLFFHFLPLPQSPFPLFFLLPLHLRLPCPSLLLCLCCSSALFSLLLPFPGWDSPLGPCQWVSIFGRLGAHAVRCVDDCRFGGCVWVCAWLRSQLAACGPIGVNTGVTFQFGYLYLTYLNFHLLFQIAKCFTLWLCDERFHKPPYQR